MKNVMPHTPHLAGRQPRSLAHGLGAVCLNEAAPPQVLLHLEVPPPVCRAVAAEGGHGTSKNEAQKKLKKKKKT